MKLTTIKSIRKLALQFSIITVFFTAACSSIGNGDRVILKRCITVNDLQINVIFPEFTEIDDNCFYKGIRISGSVNEARSNITLGSQQAEFRGNGKKPNISSTKQSVSFEHFISQRYGNLNSPDELANLDVVVRRKDKTPFFIYPEEEKLLRTAISAVELNEKLSDTKKNLLVRRLESKLFNRPRMTSTTLPTKTYKNTGKNVYDYFPRVEIDFSTKLNSLSEHDTFKHLGIIIKLHDNDPVQIVDFSPKEADIVEYTHGSLVRSSALAIAPSLSKSLTESALKNTAGALAAAADTESTSEVRNSGLGTTGLTLSESLTSELVDALERRTTGVLNDGKTFFASYRSTKNKRIIGTFNYDLMLKVESDGVERCVNDNSKISETYYQGRPVTCEGNLISTVVSAPKTPSIKADIYLLGVVRHVVKRGMSGTLNTAPEIENDDVFEQVIIKKIENKILWEIDPDTFGLFTERVPNEHDPKQITVYTNHKNARFGILSVKEDKESLLAIGSGQQFKYSYSKDKNIKIVPYDVVVELENIVATYVPKVSQIMVDAQTNIMIEYELKN